MPTRRNRRNYYRILHVQPDAPPAVLKSSYRTLMRHLEMHPDRGGEHWNAALINEAYDVLSDPARRAEYDVTVDVERHRGRTSPPGRRFPETARPPAQHDAGRSGCPFCGATRTAAGHPSRPSECSDCRSPLTPVGSPQQEIADRRNARRLAGAGAIRFWTSWPQRAPHEGRIVDVSPRGLRFECGAPIEPLWVVKIEGQMLDAVAQVASCRAVDPCFSVGVQFSTVRFHRDRGGFFSRTA